jgi:pimeloyl-ACP methyl ester carboxylesterase
VVQPDSWTFATANRIAWNESGDPAGYPVFFFHGWPASRLQGSGLEMLLRSWDEDHCTGPPWGRTFTFQAGRKLLDWPPMRGGDGRAIGDQQFRVFGIYWRWAVCCATAWALPEAVEAVAVVQAPARSRPRSTPPSSLPSTDGCWGCIGGGRQGSVGSLFIEALLTIPPPRWAWRAVKLAAPSDAKALNDPAIFCGSWDAIGKPGAALLWEWRQMRKSMRRIGVFPWEEICVPFRPMARQGRSELSLAPRRKDGKRIPDV